MTEEDVIPIDIWKDRVQQDINELKVIDLRGKTIGDNDKRT